MEQKLSFKAKLCRFILTKVMGWKTTPPPTVPKCILIGVPHTSMFDFVVSYLYYKSYDMETHVMIKKALFWWPLGAILRGLGAIPVDVKTNASMVRSVIQEMNDKEYFHLALAPEGTRAPVKRWKKGYHLIAKAVDCPVMLAYFDWGTKRVGISQEMTLTDDANADTARMQQIYEDMHLVGKHPEKYITH